MRTYGYAFRAYDALACIILTDKGPSFDDTLGLASPERLNNIAYASSVIVH